MEESVSTVADILTFIYCQNCCNILRIFKQFFVSYSISIFGINSFCIWKSYFDHFFVKLSFLSPIDIVMILNCFYSF